MPADFVAVHQYASHRTGIVSAMADNIALGFYGVALGGPAALLPFTGGAVCSAVLVGIARRRHLHAEYALPLLIEAALLLCFGLLGAWLSTIRGVLVPLTVVLLCFIMGLQNAVMTKLSNAEIRTTHVTEIVADIGIELGKLLCRATPATSAPPGPQISRTRLGALSLLAASFFVGGVVGAMGFKHLGYASTLPLAVVLIALAGVPTIDDLRLAKRRRVSRGCDECRDGRAPTHRPGNRRRAPYRYSLCARRSDRSAMAQALTPPESQPP